MAKHQVIVTQVYNVTRRIAVEVEAIDPVAAVEAQDALEAPDFDDPAWKAAWRLLREQVDLPV